MRMHVDESRSDDCSGRINSFLDKGFGFNRTTLWLYLGECIGVGIVTLTSQLPILFGGLRERRKIHMHVLVGGMIIAIICVSASRLIGLSPGYCYGLIAVFVLRPHTDEKDWGRLHAIASVCVLIVATAAFLLTVPVYHLATASSPSPNVRSTSTLVSAWTSGPNGTSVPASRSSATRSGAVSRPRASR